MNCIYTYRNGNIELVGSSIEEIRALALKENLLETGSYRSLFLLDLNFFHAPTDAEIMSTLNRFKSNSEKRIKFTDSVTDIANRRAELNESNYSPRMIWARDTAKSIGTFIHKCIENHKLYLNGQLSAEDYKLVKDEFIKFINNLREKLENDSELKKDMESPFIAEYQRQLRNFVISFIDIDGTQDKFFQSVEETLKNLYGKDGLFNDEIFSVFETQVYTNLINSEDTLGGIIDCITYDPQTKEIIIYDFKTSANAKASNSLASKKSHYLQLELYRNLLSKELNVPLEKIKIKNIYFIYNTSNGLEMKEEIDTETSLGATNEAAALKLVIRQYFPQTSKPITSEHSQKLTQETIDASNNIISDSMLKRNTLESIKYHIEEASKNQQEIWLSLHPDNKSITEIKKINDIYYLYDSNKKEVIHGTLDEIAEAEVKAIKEKESMTHQTMIDAIRKKDLTYLKSSLERKPKLNRQLYLALSRYFSTDWEYISNPDLENFGIVLMYNSTKKLTDFIILITDSANTQFISDPHKNILFDVYKDKKLLKEFKEFDQLPSGSIQNLYKLRALIALSKFKDTLSSNITIGALKTVSTLSGIHDLGLNTEELKKVLHLLEYGANHYSAEDIESPELYKTIYSDLQSLNWKSNEEIIATNTVSALRVIKEDPTFGFNDLITEDVLNLKIEALLNLLEEIKLLYPDIIENKHFETGIGALYGEISYYLNSLMNLVPTTMHEMHKSSITFLESIIAGFNLLTKAETNKYTRRGLQLTALAQGLETSISYANPDELIRRTNALFNNYGSQITTALLKDINEINLAVKDWFRELNIPLDNKLTGGIHNLYYARFLQRTEDGKINRNMLFINPYLKENNALFTSEKEKYALECILWGINRSRMHGMQETYLKLSYAELKTNKNAFKEYTENINNDSSYLKVPLRKKLGSSKIITDIKAFTEGKKDLKNIIRNWVDSWKQFVEPVILSEDLSNYRDEAIEEGKYYNYFVENDRNRSQRTEITDPDEWEMNFNRIAGEYIAENYKEIYFNKFLKIVDRLLATIKFMELITGKNFENQFDALTNRIKISVYNKALIDKEYEDLVTGLGGIKYLASLAKIAVRPTLFMKEMILGRIKNTSSILTKFIKNDDGHNITMSHLFEAAKIVFGNNFFLNENLKFPAPLGNKGPGDFGFVDSINNVYLINDRDLNAIGDTLSYDNYGIGNWGARMLYLNTVKPDWFNRMIIFIAKMKADGTYEAHSRDPKTGLLIYDITKDKRFSYFFEHCKNDGKLASDKKLYIELKSLYKLRMDLFIKEGWTNPDGTTLKYGIKAEDGTFIFDPLPRAYTLKENDSIKEQIGLIYGYYTHEERANMQKGLWWSLHTQFLTFLPGEIRKYFANGKTDSSITRVVHVETPEKDSNTGERLKLYYKYDEKSGLTKKVTTTNNSGVDSETGEFLEPVYESVNCPLEGLAVSAIKTVGRLCRGDFKDLKEDPEAWNKTKLFIFNMLFAMIIYSIIKLFNSTTETEMQKNSLALTSSIQIFDSAAGELNLLEILKPVTEVGLVGIEYTQEVLTSATKAIGSENYNLLNLASDNIGIIKDLHLT